MPIGIKEYYSGQTASAGTCSGTAGALITILDNVLVNGWNSKSISGISVSNNIATATTTTDHNFAVGEVVAIAGCDTPTYAIFNDDFTILSTPLSTTFTFALTTGLNNPTGTITCKYSPLGWTKPYNTTNVGIYRSADVTGTQLYLRVDDTNGQYSIPVMYEAMTAHSSGSGLSTSLANTYWRKSNASDSNARAWWIVGNTKMFYLFIDWYSGTQPLQPNCYAFGDFISVKPNDVWNCLLVGYNTSVPGTTWTSGSNDFPDVSNTSSKTVGQIIARSYTQTGTAINFYKSAYTTNAAFGYGTSALVFPNPCDNGIHLFPVGMMETTTKLRGFLAGAHCPMEATSGSLPFRNKITVGAKTFMSYNLTNVAVTNGQIGNIFFDMTGPWV